MDAWAGALPRSRTENKRTESSRTKAKGLADLEGGCLAVPGYRTLGTRDFVADLLSFPGKAAGPSMDHLQAVVSMVSDLQQTLLN